MNATEIKTYRGRSLEEVLPKIKADLGPDAEIVRQRSGLTGGVGGFFQRQMVEVEAKAPEAERPRRRFDAYDEEPAREGGRVKGEEVTFVPELPIEEGLSAPGIQEIFRRAPPFADRLSPALDPATPPSPFTVHSSPKAKELTSALTDAGLDQ